MAAPSADPVSVHALAVLPATIALRHRSLDESSLATDLTRVARAHAVR